MKKIIITLIFLFSFIPFINAKEVEIYLFYSNSCPHCANEKEFLSTLEDIKVKKYEVTQYSKLYDKVVDKLNIDSNGVPLTIIGSDYIVGFNENTKTEITEMIDAYSKKDYCDVVDLIIRNKDITSCIDENKTIYENNSLKEVKLLGKTIKFDAKEVSLPLIAIIIGFIDGFNPCAMWVLIFLISKLFNIKNKKKMWLLGLTFIITSALMYLIFMLGIFGISNIIGTYFKYLIGLVALIGGFINLKSFKNSLKKDVGCTVTNKEQKKKIINKIKKILNEKNLLISLIGIILLAISVNIVELACSAGLPAMFVEILSLNDLSKNMYIFYMLIYILVFMLDDIIVFAISMITLEVTGVSNKYTKYSHLIGGIIMLVVGILMMFKTEWLMFNF